MSVESPAPAVEAGAAADEWRRLSPRMLLVHPVREIGRAVPALVAVVFAGSSSGNGQYWGLIGAGIVAALSLTRWFTTRYRVGADQVQIREGLIRRRMLTTRLERVRTVDVTSTALHRALGLARVEIGTGVSDRKGKSSLRLDGLPAADAARLRSELLHRSAAVGTEGPAGAQTEATSDAAYAGAGEVEIARLDPAWIRFAPFTLSGALTGLAILGFGWRIVSESDLDLRRVGVVDSAADQLSRTDLWVAATEVVVGGLVFIALASTVRYLLAYWGFRLTRHPGGSFHVARGLLTTRATSIDVDRMRGVSVSEPLLLRLVGGARTIAIATGLQVGRGASPSGRGGTVLLPDAPVAEARRVAGDVLGVPAAITAELVSTGPVARRRRYPRALAGALLVVALTGLVWWLFGLSGDGWLLSLVAVALAVPLAADRGRSLGYLVRDGLLITQSGSLARRRSTLELDAIIGWNIRQSYFQRRAGVATLVATTAAGKQGYRLLDLPLAEARRVADAGVPGLLSDFTPA